MSENADREAMEFDVVVVGAGPAGLSAACKLMQEAQRDGKELSVCVVEKGSEVGAHILSGAIIEPRALEELFPDWQERQAPLNTPVSRDDIYLFSNETSSLRLPNFAVPSTMHNQGNYIISLGNFTRWLAEQAESLGVEIFPGFAAANFIEEDGVVKGIITGDMGIGRDGQMKDSYMPGMELRAKFTLFSEGCRGHLGKQLIQRFELDAESDPQHYGIGIKELWDIDPSKHEPGLVVHGAGWPLSSNNASGGSFLYHTENNQIVVGLIVDLNYENPYLSPFDEFQKMKHHPVFQKYLDGGKRVSYGARAITKGGFNALPRMNFPGGLLLGCDAGTLNFAKIKGTHTAMKSGMVAAEVVYSEIHKRNCDGSDLQAYAEAFKNSWAYDELYRSRNFGPALHKYGLLFGGAINFIDQNIFRGRLPFTLRDKKPDCDQLQPISDFEPIQYPRPDGILSFDKLSSVFLSSTNHEEDQPVHLQLEDPALPVRVNLQRWGEPAQRYCPAGVYEIIEDELGDPKFQINAQNCVHCKTCDIKDPSQNITWVTPEGGGGPNYPNM